MPDRVEVFAIAIPANTAKLSAIQDISLSAPGVVVGLEVIFPDGVNTVAGFALLSAHSQVLPRVVGTYVTANNEKIAWNMANYLTSGSWQVDVYNNGIYPHTLYFRFLINEIPLPGQLSSSGLAPALIPAGAFGGP